MLNVILTGKKTSQYFQEDAILTNMHGDLHILWPPPESSLHESAFSAAALQSMPHLFGEQKGFLS